MQYSHTSCVLTLHGRSASLAKLVTRGFPMNRLHAAFVFAAAIGWCAPAFAQNDFTGEWAPVRNQDNSENPLVGDWVGIPLNEAGIARSEAWDASIQSLPEWQCRPHGWAYIYRGPTALRIWKDIDPYTR